MRRGWDNKYIDFTSSHPGYFLVPEKFSFYVKYTSNPSDKEAVEAVEFHEMIMHLCITIHMKQLVTDKTKWEREREKERERERDDLACTRWQDDHRRPYTRGDSQVQVDMKNYEWHCCKPNEVLFLQSCIYFKWRWKREREKKLRKTHLFLLQSPWERFVKLPVWNSFCPLHKQLWLVSDKVDSSNWLTK